MKEVFFLYLMICFILTNDVKKKMVSEKVFYFYYLIVHISTNNTLRGLIFSMLVYNIHVEGTVSQIFVLGLTFYLMPKNG